MARAFASSSVSGAVNGEATEGPLQVTYQSLPLQVRSGQSPESTLLFGKVAQVTWAFCGVATGSRFTKAKNSQVSQRQLRKGP